MSGNVSSHSFTSDTADAAALAMVSARSRWPTSTTGPHCFSPRAPANDRDPPQHSRRLSQSHRTSTFTAAGVTSSFQESRRATMRDRASGLSALAQARATPRQTTKIHSTGSVTTQSFKQNWGSFHSLEGQRSSWPTRTSSHRIDGRKRLEVSQPPHSQLPSRRNPPVFTHSAVENRPPPLAAGVTPAGPMPGGLSNRDRRFGESVYCPGAAPPLLRDASPAGPRGWGSASTVQLRSSRKLATWWWARDSRAVRAPPPGCSTAACSFSGPPDPRMPS